MQMPLKGQSCRVFDPPQGKARTGRMHTGMVQNAGIQEFVVGLHVAGNDLQHVIPVPGDRKTLHDFRQTFDMRFKRLPDRVGVRDHADRQQDMNYHRARE